MEIFSVNDPPAFPADLVIARILMYDGELSAEEIGIIAAWAKENYGTPLPSPELPTLTVTPLYDWDMADADVDSHALVADVVDKVSGEHLSQAVVSQRPRLLQGQFLGRPGASFRNNDHAELIAGTIADTDAPHSAVMVYRDWDTPSGAQFFSDGWHMGGDPQTITAGKGSDGRINSIFGPSSVKAQAEGDEALAHIHMLSVPSPAAAGTAQIDDQTPVVGPGTGDQRLNPPMTIGTRDPTNIGFAN
ncbi:unnamed protein product, partial [marine sediment metagenome]